MSLTLSNAFAALEVRKAKKKKAKESDKKKKSGKEAARKEDTLQLEREIFSRPQLNVSNWADCDDEDDDFDPASQPGAGGDTSACGNGHPQDDGHESEEEIDLEKEFGVELGPEAEPEVENAAGVDDGVEGQAKSDGDEVQEQVVSTQQRNESRGAPPERTMSKKEIKKKEMEELDAMLAELGIAPDDSGKKEVNGESSGLKRKKSRRKNLSIDAGPAENKAEPLNPLNTNDDSQPSATQEEQEESTQEEGVLDPEVAKPLKPRLSSKKKSQKKLAGSAAAVAAAAEARARSKKKGKKDTSHYNQAPTR